MRFRDIGRSLLLVTVALVPLCSQAITVEITATVPGCGDGVMATGEQCDGSDFGAASCSSQGFTGGSLSCTSSCTLSTAACTAGNSNAGIGTGGGGSGGGSTATAPETLATIPLTNVVFAGKAYPLRTVTLLKDAQIIATTTAEADATFQMTISGVSGGNYIFGVYADDGQGNRSPLLTFPVTVTDGVTTKVSDIVIAPVVPVLPPVVKPASPPKGDLSSDGKINLIDFSMIAFWYKRPLSAAFRALEAKWLNGDGKINLVDFSILAFYWTG